MKNVCNKCLKALIIYILLFIFLVSPVFAQDSVKDLDFQLYKYRDAKSEFEKAKSQYQKFRTIATENDASLALKNYIFQKIKVLRAYLLILIEKTNNAPQLNSTYKDKHVSLVQEEIKEIDSYAQELDSMQSPTISSVLEVSNKIDQKEKRYRKMGQEIIYLLIINKTDMYNRNLDSLEKDLEKYINEKNIVGLDNLLLEINKIMNDNNEKVKNLYISFDNYFKSSENTNNDKLVSGISSNIGGTKSNINKILDYQKVIFSQIDTQLSRK